MELIRGWNSKYIPEKTGRIRLCKATYYHDVDTLFTGIRDEKEGETRLSAETTVTRDGEDDLLLPETTVTVAFDDDEVIGTARLERGSKRATFRHEFRAEVHPVPYIFCTSRKPDSADEEKALHEALPYEYDAWYTIKDADRLGRELEKAINGWLSDRQITERTLIRRYDWVKYYQGESPRVLLDIADISNGIRGTQFADYVASMEAWFNKRLIFEKEAEYRYAYIIRSPQLRTLPNCICIDLTMSAIELFERT